MSVLKRFWIGFASPIQGFAYIFNGPKVWPLAMVPVIVSTSLMIFGLSFGLPKFIAFFQAAMGAMINTSWIVAIMTFFAYIFYFLILIFLVLIGSRILLVPFNSMIAEKVLNHMGVLKNQNQTFSEWIAKSFRILGISLIQALFFAVVGTVLFLLSLIPIFQIIAFVLGMLLVAFDCADYAMEIAELTLSQKLKLFKSHLPEFAGFGLLVGLTFLVPLLNFFFLPIAIIGATRLVGTFDELWRV